jgi:hypothetical protein
MRDYWMHRDAHYALQLSTDIRANAERTVALTNRLLERAAAEGVCASKSDNGFGCVNSGWRPASVNAQTPRAAKNSKHMTGQAIDVSDDDGVLDEWLLSDAGQRALEDLGLWMEHPAATKGWCHLQTVPPASGRRVFYP